MVFLNALFGWAFFSHLSKYLINLDNLIGNIKNFNPNDPKNLQLYFVLKTPQCLNPTKIYNYLFA